MGRGKFVVGLVGQICAGKSAVAETFRRLGARVYDADKCVHELYTRPEVIADVRAMFGEKVINSAGKVDRKALGEIVLNDPAQLKRLTGEIIYPRTGKAMQEEIQRFQASDAPALALDAPTLIEAGRADVCDHILFVSAPLERRIAWARARGWDRRELERREALLQDEAGKRKRAVVLENSGTLEEMDREARKLFDIWSKEAAATHRS